MLARMPACLPACLPAPSLPASQSLAVPHMHRCLHFPHSCHSPVCPSACLPHIHPPACVSACLPACLPADTWKWLLSILIGAVMGVLAFAVDWGIDAMNNFKFGAVRGAIADKGGNSFIVPVERWGQHGGGQLAADQWGFIPIVQTGHAAVHCQQWLAERLLGLVMNDRCCLLPCMPALQEASWLPTSPTWASPSCLPSWLAASSGAPAGGCCCHCCRCCCCHC
jgi:hypothetical protein